MQLPGANLASSIMGAAQAKARDAASKLKAKRHEPRPEPDRANARDSVERTAPTEPTRNMKGNEQEETREDRLEQHGLDPYSEVPPPPTLDVRG